MARPPATAPVAGHAHSPCSRGTSHSEGMKRHAPPSAHVRRGGGARRGPRSLAPLRHSRRPTQKWRTAPRASRALNAQRTRPPSTTERWGRRGASASRLTSMTRNGRRFEPTTACTLRSVALQADAHTAGRCSHVPLRAGCLPASSASSATTRPLCAQGLARPSAT